MKNKEEEKKPRTKTQRFGIMVGSIFSWLMLFAGWIFLLRWLPGWTFLPFFLIWLISGFLWAYFVLAREDIRAGFAILPEGHAFIITKMGAFERVIINWKGHRIDSNYNVVKEPRAPSRRFGGLTFFRFPLEDIKIVKEDEDIASAKISLMDRVIDVEIKGAEDKEGIRTTLQGYIKGRVINPYKIAFRIDPPWLPKLKAMFEAGMRDAITRRPFLLAIKEKKDMAKEMWEALQQDGVIQEWKEKYGFEITEFGVKNIDVERSDHYEAMLEEWKGSQIAKGIYQKAKGEADAIRVKAEAVKKEGDEGRLVVIADAMAKSPLAAAETVHAIPGLGLERILRGAFGKEEIKDLIEGLKEGLREKGGKE